MYGPGDAFSVPFVLSCFKVICQAGIRWLSKARGKRPGKEVNSRTRAALA